MKDIHSNSIRLYEQGFVNVMDIFVNYVANAKVKLGPSMFIILITTKIITIQITLSLYVMTVMAKQILPQINGNPISRI